MQKKRALPLLSVNLYVPFKWVTLVLKVKESTVLHFMPNGDSKFVKCFPEAKGFAGCPTTK